MDWTCCELGRFSVSDLENAYSRLSPSRKAHIDRFRRVEDKNRSLAGELLVQQLLREHYGITDAQLHRSDSGQPYLTGCRLYVSISHCEEMVACAVSEAPVGIDIERIRPIDRKLCGKVCVPEEMHYVLGEGNMLARLRLGEIRDPEILQRFFEVWTAKEAWFKKCGTGITDLKSVNVLPKPRQLQKIGEYILQVM